MTDNQTQNRVIISDAVWLAILSAIAYWLSYSYEISFLGTYGIPADFASIKLETILFTGMSLFGATLSLVMVGNFTAMIWPKHVMLQMKAARICLIASIPVTYIWLLGFRKNDLFLYGLVLGYVTLFELIWPIFVFKGDNLVNKFIKDEISENPIRARSLFSRMAGSFGDAIYVPIIALIFGTMFSRVAGVATATKKAEYYVLANKPACAVVRAYSDRILCVEYEENSHDLIGRIEVFSIDKDSILVLTKKKIGPLKLKPTSEVS